MLPWLAPALRAFWRLSDERQHVVVGHAVPLGLVVIKSRPQRIPWSAVARWCDWHRLPPDEAAFLERCILILDREYLAWMAEKDRR